MLNSDRAHYPIDTRRSAPVRSATSGFALALMLCAAIAAAKPSSTLAPVEIEPPMRDLWSRDTERFHRQWLIAGPVAAKAAQNIAVASLQPAAGQSLSGELPQVQWKPYTSWGDIVDLASAAGPVATRNADGYFYVSATLNRERAGAADLLVGTKQPLIVWFNAERIHERTEAHAAFARDSERLPVHMKQGENALLIRVRQVAPGPVYLTARVLESGAVARRAQAVTPFIVSTSRDSLRVQTHLTSEPEKAPVDVHVIAAGGRVQASASVPRGEEIAFDVATWPQGAYELRFETKTAWGESDYAYLPWYKGDAIGAARRLVDASRSAASDPAGATLRVLAAIVQSRAGEQFERVHANTWKELHAALMEYEELQLDRAKRTGSVRANGFVRLAYTDDIDGSVQFCRTYLPIRYSAAERWPLVIQLHGYNPANPPYHGWWSVDERHTPIADKKGVIYIEPHGRGNAQYLGLGEQDVLRCLEQAKARFSVDEDRVYLTGESMGGHGTWSVASRNPHLFAAAAPVYGGWDFRITSIGGPPRPDATPKNAREFFIQERMSSFSNAENLLNVPLYVVHGDSDRSVIVENSRHAVRMLQRWGYDIRYREMPGWAHEDLKQREHIVDWLLTHRRDNAPRHVRVRSADLAGAHAHWLKVAAMQEPLRIIRVDAEVLEPGVVRIDSQNVAELALDLPPELRGDAAEIAVVWNGESRAAHTQNGAARLSLTPGDNKPPLRKRPGFEGPISDVVNTPFLVVVGTTSDDTQMREYIRERADDLEALWRQWQHQPLRILDDVAVTSEQERKYSLILLGGAQENAVTRRLADRLPLTVAEDSVRIGSGQWTASDAVVQMIYPNPLAEDRYVLVVAATSPAGMWLWNPNLVEPSIGFGTVDADWTIEDGRRPPPNTPVDPLDRTIASGTFDVNWRYDDRWMTQGDASVRATWRVREPPTPGYVATPADLQPYVGRYEFPEFAATLTLKDGKLMVQVPGQPIFPLEAQSETLFRTPGSSARSLVEFIRDAENKVIGAVVEDEGQTLYGARKQAEEGG